MAGRARVTLVRHGRATAGWDRDPDPGLDDLGWSQARAVADRLASLGPLTIVSSPMRRTRETAVPLAERWRVDPLIEHAVAEIPSPVGVRMHERADWLRSAMQGTWAELGADFMSWRDDVVATVASFETDAVIYSHFIAINAVIGFCVGDDRLVVRALDNCSRTTVDIVDGTLHLVEAGEEAPETLVR